MNMIAAIDAARERWDVLEHPFYVRWERGELSRDELARYAGEYRHAVVALADAATTAAPIAGPRHAEEEAGHIELWDDFAAEAGADTGHEPLAETATRSSSWRAGDDPLGAAAILYAVEARQPAISETKLAGLEPHYRHPADPPAHA